jgi:hypothetical protein
MNIFDWHNVTIGMMVALVLLVMIGTECIFGELSKNQIVQKIINKGLNSCAGTCSTDKCNAYTNLRGNGYFIGQEKGGYDKTCMLTGWEVSHFLFHTFLGYFYNIYTSVSMSIGYEIFEKYQYDCASYIDLGVNFMGFLLGHYLRYGNISLT